MVSHEMPQFRISAIRQQVCSSAERGKGLPPLAPHPHPRAQSPTSASLRTVFLDEVEHFAENQKASVASLR
jgi:hypothetical protein